MQQGSSRVDRGKEPRLSSLSAWASYDLLLPEHRPKEPRGAERMLLTLFPPSHHPLVGSRPPLSQLQDFALRGCILWQLTGPEPTMLPSKM